MSEPQKKLSLDEAMALLEKHAAETAAKTAAQTETKKKKVKDLLKAGAKQGRGGLNINQRKLLDLIED